MSARYFIASPLKATAVLLSAFKFVALWAFVISSSVRADSTIGNTIVLNGSQPKIPITGIAEYILLDNDVAAEEVAVAYNGQWRVYDGKGISGGPDKNLWLRFSVRHNATGQEPWWLVLGWPMLNHVRLSIFNSGTQEWWHSRPAGNFYPLSNRMVKNRYLIFSHRFTDQSPQTFYLNIHSTGLFSIPIDFWRAGDFIAYGHVDLMVLGIFLGALIVMLLYNMSLAVLLRDGTYWWYCVYVASVIVYQAVASGLGAYYLWPSSLLIKGYALMLSSTGSFIAATLFVRQFLKLPEHGGWYLWANNFLLWLWFAITFSAFVLNPAIVLPIFFIASFLSGAIAMIAGAALWRKNFPAAKMFVLSWTILIASTFIYILAMQGLLPFNTFTRYSQMVGFITELVMLSLALAYRINHEITEREAAQSETLMLTKKVSEERRERLKAQMETLHVERQLNEELERHVIERTEQLNDAMLKLESANKELTELSVTDPLTKVHNRRYFDSTYINEYRRAFRSQQPLGVIVVDIDHFKNINDSYGHTTGDQCIALVAGALQKIANRPGDMMARYGGEEFIFILPGSDEQGALDVANKCRAAIEMLDFSFDGKKAPITISAGVAAWVPAEEDSYKQLINAADTALYRAKNSGRNCVKTASDRDKLAQV